MKIDWFTLIAQIINFLVLVWLLKRFLFSRIVQAMEERESKIAKQLQSAAQLQASAEEERSQYTAKVQELETQREQILLAARTQAEEFHKSLLETAHQQAEEAQAEWFESLQRERREVFQEFRERLGQQVISISRHALKELANANLERQIIQVFSDRLQQLEPDHGLPSNGGSLLAEDQVEVRTAFPLAAESQEGLISALQAQLGEKIETHFTTAPELICGIEIRARSQRLVWSLESYLTGLEEEVFQVLEESATKYATTT